MKAVKPPETSAAHGAVRAHRPHQRRAPGISRSRSRMTLVDGGARQSGEQRHPLAQGCGEIELAVHGPPGHGGDLRLEPGEVGELVDAFDGDDRAVHVAQQQPLAPVLGRQHRQVERLARHERRQQRLGAAAGCQRRDRDLRGLGLGQPACFAADDLAAAAATRPRVERLPRRGSAIRQATAGMGAPGLAAGRGAIEALVVIGGSTASGKSALALALARQLGGVIVNADSQQLFADLPILTARPPPPTRRPRRTGSTACWPRTSSPRSAAG